VVEAHADRYGLGGPEPLEDQAGRSIRVFEGLALQLPASRVQSAGLTAADLDAVVPDTILAFRRLWLSESGIEPEVAPPLLLGDATSGGPPLDLPLAAPYVVPGSRQTRVSVSLNRPQRRRVPAPVGPPDDRPRAPRAPRVRRARRPRRNRLITAIAFAACWSRCLPGTSPGRRPFRLGHRPALLLGPRQR
jgi:hypothetical protein